MDTPHHFCYDFTGVNPLILCNTESMRILIANIVRILQMTPVGDPVVELMRDPDDPTRCGITAVQIIKESLIDLHTYSESGCLYLSIFSCRRFDQLAVYEFLCEFLGTRKGWMNGVRRLRLKDTELLRNGA